MIIYLCIKYESNSLIFSKDIERKSFFRTYGREVRLRTAVILYPPPPYTLPPPPAHTHIKMAGGGIKTLKEHMGYTKKKILYVHMYDGGYPVVYRSIKTELNRDLLFPKLSSFGADNTAMSLRRPLHSQLS